MVDNPFFRPGKSKFLPSDAIDEKAEGNKLDKSPPKNAIIIIYIIKCLHKKKSRLRHQF